MNVTASASSQGPFKFDLAKAKPSITEYGNTIREANQKDFPVLAGNGTAMFTIDMKPGALRVPHWHPNAWELDYCLQGEAEFWIMGPDNTKKTVTQVFKLQPGQIGFIPQGWFHAIKNVGKGDLKLLLVFNNGAPSDIGITTGLSEIGKDVFAQAFGVSPSAFNHFNENNKFFAPAADWAATGGRRKK